MPFFSMHCTKIPDNVNPNKILGRDEILLYNPIDKTSPYKVINPEGLDLNQIKTNFIVTKKSIKDNHNIENKNEINNILKNNSDLLKTFEDVSEFDNNNSNENKYKYGNEGKGKNNSFSKLTPKNQG
jgi:hypothetical protein